MSTDRFNPDPDTFTPDVGSADLTADPTTGRGPGGEPIGGDTPAGDVNATAGGDAPADPGPDGDTGQGLGAPEKDPSDWVTGDEPMTGPQASYLSTLAREAGEEAPEHLSKAEASEKIDELQDRTGRGS